MSALTRPPSAIRAFITNESTAGLVLMAAAAVAMVVANTPFGPAYREMVHFPLGGMSIEHWVNDGLMALFFLLVGLEIKREIVDGELSTWSRRALPGLAALGGMVVPALIYVGFNLGSPETLRGWAIPAATDIAFALGVLTLLGKRVPVSLKVFLTALAVLDDLGAILMIALFYTAGLDLMALAGAGLMLFILIVLNRLHVMRLWPYLILSVALWWFMLQSGIHATLAGVAAAMTIPVKRTPGTPEAADPPLHILEHRMQPFVAFLVLPVFGFVNAGVSLFGLDAKTLAGHAPMGVVAGLFLGKQIGVMAACWLAVKLRLAERPTGASWLQVYGVSLLCGVGFTMSLFIALLAFPNHPELIDSVKLGVLGGSLLSALAGAAILDSGWQEGPGGRRRSGAGLMPAGPDYRPDPVFAALGPEFADPVSPAAFPKSILRFRNNRAAATVGLDTLSDGEWLNAFARFEPLPGNQAHPLAMRYHGHQFRTYNPDLGDGRGFLFAQLREAGTGRLLDLATKGSGTTPWSRSGDGRLTLKGGVREILAAAMLEALGVPTSRAFSLVETGEALIRGDEPSPTRSSVLTRLSHSHIRFGTFQRLAYLERPDLLEILIGHAIETYYPESEGAVGLLAAAVERTAVLTAGWMAAGFVHGVLNTDNMNITGESFDYGPWRFLPRSDPAFTAAYFDHNGLYAFGRQPEAAFWNLQQLAASLTLVSARDPLIEILNGFETAYVTELIAALLRRLGVASLDREADTALVNAAFRTLAAGGETLRWEPFFFDWFCGPVSQARAMGGPRGAIYAGPEAQAFRDLIRNHAPERPERLAHPYFERVAPEELLIDEVKSLWAPIADADDWKPLQTKLERIESARIAWGFDFRADIEAD